MIGRVDKLEINKLLKNAYKETLKSLKLST